VSAFGNSRFNKKTCIMQVFLLMLKA